MKQLTFLLAFILLNACSTTPSPPRQHTPDPDKHWEQRKQSLSEIKHWLIRGRVAIINGHESWFINIEWQRHNEDYLLDLSGPFGAGHAQLTGKANEVVLVDAEQNYFQADSPDRLLQEVTGIRMPVASLLYWMKGVPNWNVKKQEEKIDAFGRLKELKQDGWRVRFKRYINVAQHELPEKIFIDGHHLKVKLFVESWDLKTSPFIKEN